MTNKRKADTDLVQSSPSKRSATDIKSAFRSDLFDAETVSSFHQSYTTSQPYQHAVVQQLIQPSLLRSVRSEITENIHFTLKETDIYRIHQSGDLANLSNLDQDSLRRLPSLVTLRDALYSPDFRQWVSSVTGAGKLSGKKTDMAVNVYTPGSYLLCHDDVIGTRRVSYILYLTDPDDAWKPEWGGGLRLYPTEARQNAAGDEIKVPTAEWSLTIPPSFGQLSFFAVRPGESYHDVEEVYHGAKGEDARRIRMAVSGWFHIPQEGEDGFEQGVEQAQAQKSSLAQLQGSADEVDEPVVVLKEFEARRVANASATGTELDTDDGDEDILTEQDLTFLIQYIAPGFLVPDKLEELAGAFTEQSMLQLESFLAEKFVKDLKPWIEQRDKDGVEWPLARPPHKHRYAYLSSSGKTVQGPFEQLVEDLVQSQAFKKWLAFATGLKPRGLTRQHTIARCFRAGHDYALANTYKGSQPQLEFTINLTPSLGWERGDDLAANGDIKNGTAGAGAGAGGSSKASTNGLVDMTESPEFGGEEVYMAGDDEEAETASNHSKALPSVGKKAAHDPAVYRAGQDEDDDDGILYSSAPTWNSLSIVLRDSGVMRFVKYVSQAAKGNRWDIKGEVELSEDAFDDDDEGGNDMGELGNDDVEEEIEFDSDEEGDDDDDDDEDE